MANLSYKTRIGVQAKGLQKIWFCAHPSDYATYLDSISEEILSIINCAVWYDSEPTERYDKKALEEDLSLMRLFVVPVTKEFLLESNRALDVELPIALAHNIPVLPILEDSALVNLFNKKCGNLQYLSPMDNDATQASYQEKLSEFVSSILVGDELVQKAKDAFDAYIFLSYRKKDRAYAQELMRLIHKNEFCRDVAIWYDEFLIPGENFDDAIKKAMEKSRLFTLVVTPNLLEKDNYVLQIEYPSAKKSGIRVLPAEMLKTDEAELRKNYPDLPTVANARNQAQLTKVLQNALSEIAKKELNSDPTHKFFIGLAYLGGIDVEIDKQRAIRLITDASDDGLIEATRKLVSLYRYGEVGAKNEERVRFFQTRLIEQTKKAYEEIANEETLNDYVNAVCQLASEHVNAYQNKKAKNLYDSILAVCENAPSHLELAGEKHTAYVFGLIAYSYQQQGRYQEACSYYRKSYLKLHDISRKDDSFDVKMAQATSYVDLANAEDRLNDYSSALKEIERATELLQELEKTLSDDEPPRGNFSYCYNLMANFMLRHKRYEEALSYLEKCIQIDARSSPFMHPVTVLEHDTVNSSMLYSIYRALGQTEKATQYLQKSYSSAKAYHEKSNALKTEELYAATTARLGIAAMWDDEFEKANSLLKEAYQRLERIAKLTLSTFSISWQGSILENYHNLFTKQGKINLAEPLYQKQIALYENAVKELKNINLTLSLARSYYSYAKAIGIPSRKKDCAILYQKATSTFFSAYKKTYNQTTLQKAMISCRDFNELAIELQDEELIFQGYQKLIDCYCETREKSPSDYAKIINAASYLAPKANERLAVKYNLLISCYATELLLSEPNDEELIQQKRYAEEKLREFDARHGIRDYAVDTYDNYFEYFLDRKEPTAKRLAATLLTFIGDNRIDEYQISNYYAADRQYATLLKDFPNDEFLIKQREILAEKIQRAREMEEEREKDPFEGIDIKALVDEVYGSDENE